MCLARTGLLEHEAAILEPALDAGRDVGRLRAEVRRHDDLLYSLAVELCSGRERPKGSHDLLHGAHRAQLAEHATRPGDGNFQAIDGHLHTPCGALSRSIGH